MSMKWMAVYAVMAIVLFAWTWDWQPWVIRRDIDRQAVALSALYARVDSLQGIGAYDAITDRPVGHWTYHPAEVE